MKTLAIFLALLLYQLPATVKAQIHVPVKKKVVNKTNREANDATDQAIDEGFNQIKGLFKKKNKKSGAGTQQNGATQDQNTPVNQPQTAGGKEVSSPEKKWSKYDFVPGTVILFDDNLRDEENGEFPSRWDLISGRVETVEFDGKNSISFFTAYSKIIPYIKDRDKDYLPESFTVEFDAWFEKNEYTTYQVWLWDVKNQKSLPVDPINISGNEVGFSSFKDFYPGTDYAWNNESSFWRHVAIAFNKRSLKVYLDDTRIINVPNVEVNPSGITIACDGFNTAGVKGINRIITNVRIAEGGPRLYDKFLTDGKIVATGIKFETNKATLKPESMGVINRIYKIMKDHPDLKFSVEGHTDNVGNEDFNMKLSLARAETVRDKLISMGIASDRFTVKGFGETVPTASNDTPEGRANNRRVEFVKM
jgi:hypothetical protein